MSRFVPRPDRVGRRIDTLERLTDYVSRGGRDVQFKINPNLIIGRGATGAAVMLNRGIDDNITESGLASPGRAEGAIISQEKLYDITQYPEDDVPSVQSTLPEVEDRRFFDPNHDDRTLRRVSSKPLRRSVATVGNTSLLRSYLDVPIGVSPEAKDSVLLCVRRHVRRGVLLALDRGGHNRPPRRVPTSDIWCE